jgi:tetratricopeptide (TPR) repeat protein
MSVRYEAGDRAGALAAFTQFAERMRDEMDAEPMAETTALREAILRGARLATSEPATEKRTSISAALPFVGREETMERAIERWHVSADGHAGALFLAGEAGIGKSRFVAELARAIEREGGVTLVGETAAGGERRPYEAMMDALRYTPALQPVIDEHLLAALGDDRSARIRLFGIVQKAVRELARARPLAIVLEDLHWAGPATIDLIGYLIERLGTASVLLVATFRDEELPRPHALRDLVRDAERWERATRVSLKRLGGSDATRAARAAVPETLSAEALDAAVAWSEGVPLMLSEAVRDLTAGRELTGGDFRSVIGERLARLTPEAETALNYAAVLGARFELETLAASIGWRDDELVDALAPSMELGLIRAGGLSHALTFAFSPHMIHAETLSRISEPDRIRVHTLVARALRTLFKGRDRALEIAQHYAAAGDAPHAAEQFSAGARYALDVYANEDARDAATAGLAFVNATEEYRELRYTLVDVRERALARIGAPVERLTDAELLCVLAAGDEWRSLNALERLVEALRNDKRSQTAAIARLESLATTSQLAAASYERTVANEALLDGDFPTAAAAAERASRHFDVLTELDASLRVQLVRVNALTHLGERADAAEVIAQVRPLAELCDDLSLRMQFHHAASFLGADGTWEIAASDAERSLELALRIGDGSGEALARHQLGWAMGNLGDCERSLSEYERAIQVYADIGNMPGAANTMLNLAGARGWLGDYDGAFRLLDELESPALDRPFVETQREAHRGSLWLRAGNLEQAERYLLSALEHARQLGMAPFATHLQVCLAELEARRGNLLQACLELDAARVALEQLKFVGAAAEAHALLARVHAELHDSPATRKSIDAALAAAEKTTGLELTAKFWWNLVAASALLGDATGAYDFAGRAARAFSDDALAMHPDLAYTYGRLPWNIAIFAYLAGREVSLTLAD